MFFSVCVLTFVYQDTDHLEERVNCFAGLLLYGAKFVTGESEITSWCHIVFEFCLVCAEFPLSVGC